MFLDALLLGLVAPQLEDRLQAPKAGSKVGEERKGWPLEWAPEHPPCRTDMRRCHRHGHARSKAGRTRGVRGLRTSGFRSSFVASLREQESSYSQHQLRTLKLEHLPKKPAKLFLGAFCKRDVRKRPQFCVQQIREVGSFKDPVRLRNSTENQKHTQSQNSGDLPDLSQKTDEEGLRF